MIIIAAVLLSGEIETSWGEAGEPWARLVCIGLLLVGVVVILRAEHIDHQVDRHRGTIELSWRSLIKSRRRTVRCADVASILIDEDRSADYGRPHATRARSSRRERSAPHSRLHAVPHARRQHDERVVTRSWRSGARGSRMMVMAGHPTRARTAATRVRPTGNAVPSRSTTL